MTEERPVHGQQAIADRALRELFAHADRPVLSPFFAQRCASRASLAPAARPLGPRQRLLMRAYWVLTLIVSGAVIARAEWPPTLTPAAAAALAVTVATIVTPTVLLLHVRGGFRRLVRRPWSRQPL
jgi:hypothetical protein